MPSEPPTTIEHISRSLNLRDILDISFDDACGKAFLWGEFAEEFLRLGLLAHTMRGSDEIIEFATKAATTCRNMMDAEILHAERHKTTQTERTNAE